MLLFNARLHSKFSCIFFKYEALAIKSQVKHLTVILPSEGIHTCSSRNASINGVTC